MKISERFAGKIAANAEKRAFLNALPPIPAAHVAVSGTKDRAFRVALCGVITAMAVSVMFLSFIPAMAYTMPCAAGIILATIRIHINRSWALLAYVAASLLTLILVAEPEAQMLFVLLLGYYPTVKTDLERKLKPAAAWVIKFVIFNIAAVLVYNAGKYILGITDDLDGLETFGAYAVYVFWLQANVTFWLYDICTGRLMRAYGIFLLPKIERQRS